MLFAVDVYRAVQADFLQKKTMQLLTTTAMTNIIPTLHVLCIAHTVFAAKWRRNFVCV